MSDASRLERLEALFARLPERGAAFSAAMGKGREARMAALWQIAARPAQLPPPGDWRVWMVMAGRGFGKTRAGAEWVCDMAQDESAARIALVGASLAEARAVMVEGESGVLAVAARRGRRLRWLPSLRKLIWPNGAQAEILGAAEPEHFRGPQFSHGWCDEIGKWPRGTEAWTNLQMALRLGTRPQVVATTTPRAVPLVRKLAAEAARAESGIVMTRGRTDDNRANLPAAFLDAMAADYGGTRIGRQELDGELIEEVAGALWRRAMLEDCRCPPVRPGTEAMAGLSRIVIGVDPPAGTLSGDGGDACGIVVVALRKDGRAAVLEDASVSGALPEGWAQAVAQAAGRWGADRVIAEANNGGAMVESVLRAADTGLPVRLVHASRGKAARAEPVAALYEAGRVVHAGAFPALEDEMCGLIAGGGYEGPGRSPDRADALVWALTELMLGKRGAVRVRGL